MKGCKTKFQQWYFTADQAANSYQKVARCVRHAWPPAAAHPLRITRARARRTAATTVHPGGARRRTAVREMESRRGHRLRLRRGGVMSSRLSVRWRAGRHGGHGGQRRREADGGVGDCAGGDRDGDGPEEAPWRCRCGRSTAVAEEHSSEHTAGGREERSRGRYRGWQWRWWRCRWRRWRRGWRWRGR